MGSTSFVKAITLVCFAFLIILFLLYRTGKLEYLFNSNSSSIQTSPNGAAINGTKKDTLVPQKDSLPRLRFPSSKSVVLVEQKPSPTDSLRKKYKDDITRKEKELMPGSKSAYVFRPRYPLTDSLRKDSIQKQMQKLKQQ